MNIPDDDVVFSEEQVRAIIARAIDIDDQKPLTRTQLRAIASDIGVSPTALALAMREEVTRAPHAPVAESRATAMRVARRLAALGVPMGVVAGGLIAGGPMSAVVGVMGASLILSGALAMYESVAGTLRSFHIKNLILWGGALVGGIAAAMLVGGGTERGPLLVAGAWAVRTWLASGILGSATMLAVHRAREQQRPNTLLPPATSAVPGGRLTTWLRRMWHKVCSERHSHELTSVHHAPAA